MFQATAKLLKIKMLLGFGLLIPVSLERNSISAPPRSTVSADHRNEPKPRGNIRQSSPKEFASFAAIHLYGSNKRRSVASHSACSRRSIRGHSLPRLLI